MATVYDPFAPDYLDARQQERDECALGLSEQHSPVPLELAAHTRREDVMNELDAGKGRRHTPRCQTALQRIWRGNEQAATEVERAQGYRR